MPNSNFPQGFVHGLTVRGMPLLQMQPGEVFFVGNSPVLRKNQRAGSDNNSGTYQSPFATIAGALEHTVQARGDIIFVLPGHAETISDATSLYLNCNGVAIVGLGGGSLRPTITFDTANTANIPLRSANMAVQNFLFVANFLAIASVFTGIRASSATSTITGTTFSAVGAVTGGFYPGMTLTGTGVTPGTIILRQLSGAAAGIGTYEVTPSQTVTSTTITGLTTDFAVECCEFRDTTNALNFVSIVTGNATPNSMTGLNFSNNKILSLGTTAATTAIKLTSLTNRARIVGNFGCWAVLNDTAAMLSTAANNMTNFEFGNNVLERPNTSSDGGSFISSTATGWTGHAYNNYMYQMDNSAGIWIPTGVSSAGAFGFTNNYSPITGAVDKSALINPAAV